MVVGTSSEYFCGPILPGTPEDGGFSIKVGVVILISGKSAFSKTYEYY